MRRVPREWALRTPDEAAVRDIRARTGLSATAAAILANRGIGGADEAEAFLSAGLSDVSDPFRIRDLEKGARRLLESGLRREPVLIYADYDADGATGAACLFLFLKEAFPDIPVRVHQNHRIRDGYGMKAAALSEAAAAGTALVVTVDCGITDVEPIRHASSLGMDVVVTDHHEPGPEIPSAHAVIDPKRPDCGSPEKELSGAGVAFMLACGVRRLMREGGAAGGSLPVLRSLLDLVALGTVADMVPLRGDNRIFVRTGLEEIRKRPRPGVKGLLSVAGVLPAGASEADLAFRVAPRLNAASRVGEPRRGFDVLVAPSDAEAFPIAEALHRDNSRRQSEEDRMFRSAAALIPPGEDGFGAIVLSHPDWHPGILGIVASRIADRFHRPTVLLSEEGSTASGSCRTAFGFPVIEALAELSPLLLRYGGHRHAAGVALPVANVEEFRGRLDGIARRYAEGRELVPTTLVDALVELSDLTAGFMDELDRLRPFGMGNDEPVLLARNLRVLRKRVFGAEGQHVRLEVGSGRDRFEAVAFHRADAPAEPGSDVDLLFTPQRTTFRGVEVLRLILRDLRPPEGAPAGRRPSGGA